MLKHISNSLCYLCSIFHKIITWWTWHEKQVIHFNCSQIFLIFFVIERKKLEPEFQLEKYTRNKIINDWIKSGRKFSCLFSLNLFSCQRKLVKKYFFLINDLWVANLFFDLFWMFIINQMSSAWEKSYETNFDHWEWNSF